MQPDSFQQQALDACLHPSHQSVFVTGLAKSGNSAFVRKLLEFCQIKGMGSGKVYAAAATNLAVSNVNGCTLHKLFGIPVDKPLDVLRLQPATVRQCRNMQLLVIDDISLVSSDILEKVSVVLQHSRGSTTPFGGLQVVVVGDFCQHISFYHGKHAFVFESKLWKQANFVIKILRGSHGRAGIDSRFHALLEDIRCGTVWSSTKKEDHVHEQSVALVESLQGNTCEVQPLEIAVIVISTK